jgi:excisionase family DNA binding protein
VIHFVCMRSVATAMEKMLLRPTEVAETLGICLSKTYSMIAAGELPSVRMGGCIRVPVDLLREWIVSRAETTRASV